MLARLPGQGPGGCFGVYKSMMVLLGINFALTLKCQKCGVYLFEKKECGMCKGLFKFFNSEKYRDDFLNGHLYFSSLNSFRKVEKSEVFGQNDRYECCEIHQPDSVKVTIGNIELTDLAGPISICCERDVLKSNIMSFSTIGADAEFDAPLNLEVGDLSDIAVSCKSCDLNGMIDVR